MLPSFLFNFLYLNIFRDFDTYRYKVDLLNKDCLSRDRFCAVVLSISLHKQGSYDVRRWAVFCRMCSQSRLEMLPHAVCCVVYRNVIISHDNKLMGCYNCSLFIFPSSSLVGSVSFFRCPWPTWLLQFFLPSSAGFPELMFGCGSLYLFLYFLPKQFVFANYLWSL